MLDFLYIAHSQLPVRLDDAARRNQMVAVHLRRLWMRIRRNYPSLGSAFAMPREHYLPVYTMTWFCLHTSSRLLFVTLLQCRVYLSIVTYPCGRL
jgi:hypothetical protein